MLDESREYIFPNIMTKLQETGPCTTFLITAKVETGNFEYTYVMLAYGASLETVKADCLGKEIEKGAFVRQVVKIQTLHESLQELEEAASQNETIM